MLQALVIYCILIIIVSTVGGSLPSLMKLTHRRIQLVLSLVSGVMLGVALVHLLPFAIAKLGSAEHALTTTLFGLLFMFFMVRLFHFHQHDLAVDTEHDHKQKELCSDDGDHHHAHCDHHHGNLDFSWAGLCFGLAVHTLIDGVALAAATLSEHSMWVGFGVFLAIFLHKPLDAMSITSLMHAKGWNIRQQVIVSLIFSLVCPAGAALFTLGINQFDASDIVLGYSLAFSAGIFLCISLGDLLPEVHFHAHDRLQLSGMLLLGVAIAFGIEYLPGHQHSVGATSASEETVSFTSSIEPEVGKANHFTVTVQLDISKGWHTYDEAGEGPELRTSLEFRLPEGVTAVGGWNRPSGIDGSSLNSRIYEGQVSFSRRVVIEPRAYGKRIDVIVSYQACTDQRCNPPQNQTINIAIPKDGPASSRI